MIIFHNGMQLLHMHGRVWLDDTTQVTYVEWIASGRDINAIIWRYGQLSTSFGVDESIE